MKCETFRKALDAKPATALKHPGVEIQSCQLALLKENANIPLVTQGELLILCLVKLHGVKAQASSSASQNVSFILLVQVFKSQLTLGLADGTQVGWLDLSPSVPCPKLTLALSIPVSPLPEMVCNSLLSRAEAVVGSVFLVWISAKPAWPSGS